MNRKSNVGSQKSTLQFILQDVELARFTELCGQFNENINLIEKYLNVSISNRGNQFTVSGQNEKTELAVELIKRVYEKTGQDEPITLDIVHLFLQQSDLNSQSRGKYQDESLRIGRKTITLRGDSQKNYVRRINKYDLNFGIGPAGTGKSYLAVACALFALEKAQVSRIVLVRPAVEAGEKLGFLPGDLSQKVDPYLRPLYDALFDIFGVERVDQLIEKNVIEIAPLAYMRGRTLSNSFIILDESQNTTKEQMKMFLTRIGFGSTVVVTGDISQVDLPKGVQSGLHHGIKVLHEINDVGFTYFDTSDVVRHTLVQKIIEAYDSYAKCEKLSKKVQRGIVVEAE